MDHGSAPDHGLPSQPHEGLHPVGRVAGEGDRQGVPRPPCLPWRPAGRLVPCHRRTSSTAASAAAAVDPWDGTGPPRKPLPVVQGREKDASPPERDLRQDGSSVVGWVESASSRVFGAGTAERLQREERCQHQQAIGSPWCNRISLPGAQGLNFYVTPRLWSLPSRASALRV